MKKIILFIVFFVNLHVICNEQSLIIQFGALAYAQRMTYETYEAQGQECPEDELGASYYSSLPCEFDGGITADDLSDSFSTDFWMNTFSAFSVPVAAEGGISTLVQYSADIDQVAAKNPQQIANAVAAEITSNSQLISKCAKYAGLGATIFSVGSTVVGIAQGNPMDVNVVNGIGAVAGIVAFATSGPVMLTAAGVSIVCTIYVYVRGY